MVWLDFYNCIKNNSEKKKKGVFNNITLKEKKFFFNSFNLILTYNFNTYFYKQMYLVITFDVNKINNNYKFTLESDLCKIW